jgi:hypothetical protein
MQFLTTMKLPFSIYSNRALTILSKENGETGSSWSIRHFWDTPHFWGSTQTFYVVFIPARLLAWGAYDAFLLWRAGDDDVSAM